MKRKTGICVIIACFILRISIADIFYVSIKGDDSSGNGSAAKPWRSLRHAVANVSANQGHTIQISAGTFSEMGPIEVPPGVNITGAGKNLTVLKGVPAFFYHPSSPEYSTDKFLISLRSSNHVSGNQSLQHFSIDGDAKQLHGGIYVRYRSHVVIEGVKVHDTNFTGIWLWDVKDSRVAHTDLVNCSWGSTDYCVGALNLGNIERVEIDQLKVDESVGYGIKAIGPSGYNDIVNLKIHDSRISVHPYGLWNNGSAPNIAIELWQVNLVGCEIYNNYVDNTISLVNSNANPSTGIQTIRVHHNTIDLQTRAKGAGYGVELTLHDAEVDHNYFIKGRYGIANWDNPMQNWKIHHNVFYAQAGEYPGDIVRSEWSGLHNVNFYNNTIEFTGDKTMNVIGIYGGTSTQVNVSNNLFINNNTAYNYYPNSLLHAEDGAVINSLAVKNNFFNKLPIGTVAGVYAGNLTGEPKIRASGTRPDPYYAPVSGSPLIDAGLNLLLSLPGLAPDIGAFEYASSLINLKPSVNLTSPETGSSFEEQSSIRLKADASDLDGSIVKVEFFQGTTKLGEDFNPPYAFEWSDAEPGSYSLRVRATDNRGAETFSSSAAITITASTVNVAPTVAITSPDNDARFSTGSVVTILADAADVDGTILKVEFFNGTTKLGEDLTSPYAFDWIDAQAGSYSLTAKATDTEGAVTVSSAINITIGDEEFVRLGLYAPDATLSGGMKLSSDATASKGSYFSVPVGQGTNYFIPPPAKAEFNFILDKSDTYIVWVRVKTPSPGNQGYHVYDGKGHWTTWLAGVHSEWAWVKVTDAYTDKVAVFPFTAGRNIFRMAWFHENVRVDRIIITNDPGYVPEDNAEQDTSVGRIATSQDGLLNEPEACDDFAVFPNPATDQFTIIYTSAVKQEAQVSVKSATSAEEKHIGISLNAGQNNIAVDMGSERKGLYLVSIVTSDGSRLSTKVMVVD